MVKRTNNRKYIQWFDESTNEWTTLIDTLIKEDMKTTKGRNIQHIKNLSPHAQYSIFMSAYANNTTSLDTLWSGFCQYVTENNLHNRYTKDQFEIEACRRYGLQKILINGKKYLGGIQLKEERIMQQ